MIASRIALRVLPVVGQIYSVDISKKLQTDLTETIFRANLISWVAGTIPTHDITNSADAAATDAADGADAADAAAYAAARAADGVYVAVYAADAAAYAAARAARAVYVADVARAAYATDIELLEQGMKPEKLAKQPLWQGKVPPDVKEEWQGLKKHLLAFDKDWDVWIDWYEDILLGRNWAGLPDDLVEQLSIKIADQANEWWERDSFAVNADIKKWLGEAKAKEFLQKAKETASPRPIINEKNQLDVTSKTEINEPIIEEGLHLLPERARRQVNNLLVAFERKNVTPILKSSLESYLDELDKGFDFEITYLDDDMAIIRAERDADVDKIWCDGGIETAINNLSDIHDKIQKHYPLDLAREEYIEQSPIDSKMFDDEEYKEALERLVENTEAAYENEEVTEAFLNAVKRQKRQYKDIATLYPPLSNAPEIIAPVGDRVLPEYIKKRHVFLTVGFWGGVKKIGMKGSAIILVELIKAYIKNKYGG